MTIELTPEVLRALAEGIISLRQGDPTDLAKAESVELQMAKLGQRRSYTTWFPLSSAWSGYIKSPDGSILKASQVWENEWETVGGISLQPGEIIYYDEECTIKATVVMADKREGV